MAKETQGEPIIKEAELANQTASTGTGTEVAAQRQMFGRLTPKIDPDIVEAAVIVAPDIKYSRKVAERVKRAQAVGVPKEDIGQDLYHAAVEAVNNGVTLVTLRGSAAEPLRNLKSRIVRQKSLNRLREQRRNEQLAARTAIPVRPDPASDVLYRGYNSDIPSRTAAPLPKTGEVPRTLPMGDAYWRKSMELMASPHEIALLKLPVNRRNNS